jgi:prepilin-type N-terminal cleavage/methylation domain-containing protein
MRGRRGFTLVELMVVIAIILILMAFLVVLIKGVYEKASYAKTLAVVQALDKGCATYKIDFTNPPKSDTGGDARCLFKYLGRERMVNKQVMATGQGMQVRLPAIIEFKADWLKLNKGQLPDPNNPVQVVDAWDNPIKYQNPGRQYNQGWVMIWSSGKNGVDELNPNDPNFDDVTNWNKEY